MTDWNRFFTGDQLRRAISALFDPGNATATNTYLGIGTDNLPHWNTLPTATQAATATDVSGNPGFAKAWFYSTTATATGLLAFLNVTDLTRLASGRWRVNGLPFAASDYAFSLTAETAAGGGGWSLKTATGSQLASSFEVSFVNAGGAFYDPASFSGAFFGAT